MMSSCLRRFSTSAYSSYARRSCSVYGGGAMLRGHSRYARTTLISTAYKVSSACRYNQVISPSTSANVPYSGEA